MLLLLSVTFLVLVSIRLASACLPTEVFCPVDGGCSSTGCVCGHTPSSPLGYGQIIIGGASPTNISCSNTADGICPEDFKDLNSNIVGNCSSCPDPDCTAADLTGNGYVWGYVKDKLGKPIEGAVVSGNPVQYDDNTNLYRSSPPSEFSGMYNFSGFITGRYQFTASKDSYDSQVLYDTVTRGGITRLDFTLENGTCYADCTNSQGNCKAACNGMTFVGGSDPADSTPNNCTFYDSKAANLCDNVPKGWKVEYSKIDATNSNWITCCEGAPKKGYNAVVRETASSNGDRIPNIVKQVKIAMYQGQPVTIITAYWQETK